MTIKKKQHHKQQQVRKNLSEDPEDKSPFKITCHDPAAEGPLHNRYPEHHMHLTPNTILKGTEGHKSWKVEQLCIYKKEVF